MIKINYPRGGTIRHLNFGGSIIDVYDEGDLRLWRVRDVGLALGYTSNGGNLTHLFKMPRYDKVFVEGHDYVRIKADRNAIWCPTGVLIALLGFELHLCRLPKYSVRRAAIRSFLRWMPRNR